MKPVFSLVAVAVACVGALCAVTTADEPSDPPRPDRVRTVAIADADITHRPYPPLPPHGIGNDNLAGGSVFSTLPRQGVTSDGGVRLMRGDDGEPLFSTMSAFPSAASTVVGSTGFIDDDEVGFFWSAARGDSVEQSFAFPEPFITGAHFRMMVVRNSLSSASLLWIVSINGTQVAAYTVYPGPPRDVNLDVTFPPIHAVGGRYLVRMAARDEIPVGGGAHTLAYAGAFQHSVDLQGDAWCVCGGAFAVGDRVVLTEDTPFNPDLRAGHAGTVVCGREFSPVGLLLVMWDRFTGGHDGFSHCDCPTRGSYGEVITLPGSSGEYVRCDTVAIQACATDLSASGATDVADLLKILANWGPCPE